MSKVLALLAMGAAMLGPVGCHKSGMSAQELDSRIQSVLPVGTSEARVIAVLDSLQIEHSAYDPQTRTMTAIVRDVSRTSITRRSIQVELAFDEQARLARHSVRDVFTGP